MEKNELFNIAEKYIENTGRSVFLTGRAGTGKTTFLKHITETTSKRYVVLAPTGVAAINAGGSTIHSFFQLPLCPYLPDVKELITEYQMPDHYRGLRKERIKIIRTLDLLIIDEISMVRADLLDAIDMMLRRYRKSDDPFGGVQLLLIGDVQQLSPVVTDNERPYIRKVYPSPYFFCSKALSGLPYITIELQKVYRQKDSDFLEILNAIRENRASRDILSRLNSRVNAQLEKEGDSEPVRLTTHNRQADEINRQKLAALPGKDITFGAEIEGEFPESSYPADEVLHLKRRAQVMFIRNDPDGEYFNGKLGIVSEISDTGAVSVTDTEGNKIFVEPVEWQNIQYSLDSDGEIRQTVAGTFKQLPLRIAWAITVHKSQGLTFDRVIIDAGSAFAFGQVYVALSRCRSLEGISLESPIRSSLIFNDHSVSDFNAGIPSEEAVKEILSSDERKYYFDRIRDIFSFEGIGKSLGWLCKIWKTSLNGIYPVQGYELEKSLKEFDNAVSVAEKFKLQVNRIEADINSGKEYLESRLSSASNYFLPILNGLRDAACSAAEVEIDNKEVKKKVKEASEELTTCLEISCRTLEAILSEGFSIDKCNSIRTECLLEDRKATKKAKKLKKVVNEEGEPVSSVNEELRERLQQWRSDRFKSDNVPAYIIMHQSTLLEIASRTPVTKEELLCINGFGTAKYDKYGEEILEICRQFKKNE